MKIELGKGHLVRENPYKVTPNNPGSKHMRISLADLAGFEEDEKVYQFLRDDGVLLLIKEKDFKK